MCIFLPPFCSGCKTPNFITIRIYWTFNFGVRNAIRLRCPVLFNAFRRSSIRNHTSGDAGPLFSRVCSSMLLTAPVAWTPRWSSTNVEVVESHSSADVSTGSSSVSDSLVWAHEMGASRPLIVHTYVSWMSWYINGWWMCRWGKNVDRNKGITSSVLHG